MTTQQTDDSDSAHPDPEMIDSDLLTEPDEQAICTNLRLHSNLTDETQNRLHNALEGLEYKLDTFADGMHTVDKLLEDVGELADRILEEAAAALEKREQGALERAGMHKVGIGDVLRSFSRIGSGSGNANANVGGNGND